MDVQTEKISDFLGEMGLSVEEINIYLALIEHGDLTTLQLARVSGVSRTQAYRLLEQMAKKGLIEEIVDAHRMKSRAVGIEGLERLVKEQEEKTRKVTSLFPEVASVLTGKAGLKAENTKVLFYRGKEGIKQIVWNVLQAKGECLGYTYVDLDSTLGRELAEDWRCEVVTRKIHFRDITSDEQVLNHSEDTNIAGFLKLCKTRYIQKNKLLIDHQVDIYNNVIALYSWKEGDVFGVEIYNPTIVSLQKRVFNLIWEIASTKIKRC